jgi:hypothetical protein
VTITQRAAALHICITGFQNGFVASALTV